jgi:hypothetical protein
MDPNQKALWRNLIARRESLRHIRGQPVDGEPEDEREHFYICRHCGQAVDKRWLYAVLHHEQPEHQRLPEN